MVNVFDASSLFDSGEPLPARTLVSESGFLEGAIAMLQEDSPSKNSEGSMGLLLALKVYFAENEFDRALDVGDALAGDIKDSPNSDYVQVLRFDIFSLSFWSLLLNGQLTKVRLQRLGRLLSSAIRTSEDAAIMFLKVLASGYPRR